MILESEISWRMVQHTSFDTFYESHFRDEVNKLSKITSTARTDTGTGKAISQYFIDGDEREFIAVPDLVEAYNEKFKFSEDNPDHEVVYVKVIKRRSRPA